MDGWGERPSMLGGYLVMTSGAGAQLHCACTVQASQANHTPLTPASCLSQLAVT